MVTNVEINNFTIILAGVMRENFECGGWYETVPNLVITQRQVGQH